MTVSLRTPSAEEFDAWSAQQRDSYIEQLVASGSMSRDAAEAKATRDSEEFLPHGLSTPDHLIFRVEADGQPVGWLWMALSNPRSEAGVGFVYDVAIDDAFRGRGFGRAAMQLAEEEARRRGLHALALNVFAHNAVARGLYASLGYRETSVQMRKEL